MFDRFLKERLTPLKTKEIIILQDNNIRDGIDKINDSKNKNLVILIYCNYGKMILRMLEDQDSTHI
jgi:hypothetical protein